MNRRLFLAALAGAVLDPERLLWRPGAKLISIPPMTIPPYYLTTDMVTAELLEIIRSNTVVHKIGDTITVRRPARFTR